MVTKNSIIVSFIIVIVVSVIIYPGCSDEQGHKIVKIGLTSYTGDLPFFIALEKNLFKDKGIQVETIKFGNSSEALNALLAGEVDIINPISFSALIAAQIKAPNDFKLFLPGGETGDIVGSYLLKQKGDTISTIHSIKNKRIGTYTGATQLLYLKLFLEEIGVKPEEEVKIIQVAPNLQVQALEANQFDLLFTIEPFATIALERGVAEVLIENPRVKYIVDPFISGSAAVSKSFLKNNRPLFENIIEILNRSIDFIRNNEREARNILGNKEYTPLGKLSLKAGLLMWYKTDEKVNMEAIQKIADLLYENRIVQERVKMKEMFLQ